MPMHEKLYSKNYTTYAQKDWPIDPAVTNQLNDINQNTLEDSTLIARTLYTIACTL